MFSLLAVWAPAPTGLVPFLVQKVYSRTRHHLLIKLASVCVFIQWKLLTEFRGSSVTSFLGGNFFPTSSRNNSLPPSYFLEEISEECESWWILLGGGQKANERLALKRGQQGKELPDIPQGGEQGLISVVVQSLSHVWLLQPHGMQHTRLPCPSLSPGVCSSSCPLSQWCHPIISSSVAPFSSCLQSFPASGGKVLGLQHQSLQWIFRVGFL